MMRRVTGLLYGIGALASAVWACETTRNPGGIQRDQVAPTIKLSTSADTQDIAAGLTFSVAATDNLGLKDIRLSYTGGYINVTDTVFTSAVTNITLSEKVTPGSGAGGVIRIVGRATIRIDRKSTRLNSSHVKISYAVFCLKKKKRDEVDDGLGLVVR